MGRVRALAELRAERGAQIRRQGTAAMELESAVASGRKVVEAIGVTKGFDDKRIVTDFTLRVMRGDRIAFVGPNGVGKTTVLKMLTGEVQPDSGTVKQGTNLEVAVFDQSRAALDPEASLWENLTGDPLMKVSGAADQVLVRGQLRHVVAYLKDFLFDESQARRQGQKPVGRRKGAAFAGQTDGKAVECAGAGRADQRSGCGNAGSVAGSAWAITTAPCCWSATTAISSTASPPPPWRWRAMAAPRSIPAAGRTMRPNAVPMVAKCWKSPAIPQPLGPRPMQPTASKPSKELTFTDRKRLEDLPAQIARLEAEIDKLSQFLSAPDLYEREPAKFAKASAGLSDRQAALLKAEEEWLLLADRV